MNMRPSEERQQSLKDWLKLVGVEFVVAPSEVAVASRSCLAGSWRREYSTGETAKP